MRQKRILIVDDDPAMLRLVRNAPWSAGYEAHVAEAGVELAQRARYGGLTGAGGRRGELTVGDERVKPAPTADPLTGARAGQPGRVLRRQRLLQEVWGPQNPTEVAYLRNYARQLCQKLEGGDGEHHYILAGSGVGYRVCDLPASSEVTAQARPLG